MNDQYFRDALAMIAALSDEEIEDGLREHGIQFTRRASPAAAVPEGALADFAERLAASQVPLPADAASVLHDNISELYIEDSKVAAVPEGALPPLPDPIEVGGEGWGWEDFQSWMTFTVDQMQAYARAAVEADRAQRSVTPEMFAVLQSSLKVLEESAARREAQIARLAGYADRAQQGEPVAARDEPSVFLATTRGGETCYFGFAWMARGWAGKDGSVKEIKLPARDFSVVEESGAATKAAAPADAPTMESLVDALRNAALDLLELKGDASAKLEIAGEPPLYVLVGHADGIAKLLPGAAPVPDTGIPTAGEDEQELEFLKYWLRFAAEPVGMTCCGQPCVGAEYMGQVEMVCCGNGEPEFRSDKDVIDAMEVRHNELSAKLFAAGSARQGGNTKPESNDNFRAPVSSTPTSGEVEKAPSIEMLRAGRIALLDGLHDGAQLRKAAHEIATDVYKAMRAAAPSHPSEAQTCTCPSGDGSLRWPCPAHPLEAKAGEDA